MLLRGISAGSVFILRRSWTTDSGQHVCLRPPCCTHFSDFISLNLYWHCFFSCVLLLLPSSPVLPCPLGRNERIGLCFKPCCRTKLTVVHKLPEQNIQRIRMWLAASQSPSSKTCIKLSAASLHDLLWLPCTQEHIQDNGQSKAYDTDTHSQQVNNPSWQQADFLSTLL